MIEKKESSIKKSVVDNNLKSLLASHSGIRAAMLSSIDGHFIAKCANEELQNNQLSSLFSSCLALGQRMSKEAEQGGCNFVIVQSGDGVIVLKRVGRKLVLTTISKENANLGILLNATQRAAEIIYDELD